MSWFDTAILFDVSLCLFAAAYAIRKIVLATKRERSRSHD